MIKPMIIVIPAKKTAPCNVFDETNPFMIIEEKSAIFNSRI
jgi:hypothetical protein